MVYNLFRKKKNGESIVTTKCDEHNTLCRRLARIEGENAVIIVMLGIILVAVLAKLV